MLFRSDIFEHRLLDRGDDGVRVVYFHQAESGIQRVPVTPTAKPKRPQSRKSASRGSRCSDEVSRDACVFVLALFHTCLEASKSHVESGPCCAWSGQNGQRLRSAAERNGFLPCNL